jgi:hypothetical protein
MTRRGFQRIASLPVICAASAAAVSLLSGCVSDRCTGMSAPAPKEESQGSGAAEPSVMQRTPEVIYLKEMAPWPDDFGSGAAPALADLERFKRAWDAARSQIEPKVSAADLASISGWAKEQTQGAKLSPGWLASLPMHPVAVSHDGAQILFAQEAGESNVVLPSHSPVVFRRVLAVPVFDRTSGTIPRVYITIRGWAEE